MIFELYTLFSLAIAHEMRYAEHPSNDGGGGDKQRVVVLVWDTLILLADAGGVQTHVCDKVQGIIALRRKSDFCV